MNTEKYGKSFANLKEYNEVYSFYSNKQVEYYNDLISKMCHEINNPLTLISSTIQLMEKNHPEVAEIKYWSQLCTDVEDCIALLSNFNNIRNCIDVSISDGNLLQLVDSVVDSFKPIAEQKNARLTISIDKASKPFYANYPFDEIRLRQAFTNLIKNAIEAIGYSGYVHVECSRDEANLIVRIYDNGKSISKVLEDEIFSPFVTKKDKGTGVGLPIAKSIISSHMGNIHIDSNDKETIFVVTLPMP